jgi:MSHA pilin protein MshD
MKTISRHPAHRQRGVTLVELIVSIVVISIGLAGVLVAMDRNTRSTGNPMIWHQAIAVGEAYMEEILLKPFDENRASGNPEAPASPSPDPGETDRTLFDDVNDYHNMINNGCINTTPACPALGDCPCNQKGDPIAGLRGYNITVTVDPTTTINGLGGGEVELVTVTVSGPNNTNVLLSGYRTDY